MKTIVLSFGDELLNGVRVNTNAQEIALFLKKHDLACDAFLEFPDREDPDLEGFLKLLLSQPSLVITTGGLGPTADDQTRALFSRLYGRRLLVNKAYSEKTKDILRKHYPYDAVSSIPEGALLLPNTVGTACGFALTNIDPFPKARVIALPGPPDEMKSMLRSSQELLPKPIKKIHRRNFFIFGLGEHEIVPLLPKVQDIFLGIYPSYGVVEIDLTSQDKKALDCFSKEIQVVFPRAYSLSDASPPLEEFVVHVLKERKMTISSAESCTGGFLASLLTSVPGASEIFLGGLVVYSNEMKCRELSLTQEFVEENGSVSETMADALALGCQKKCDSSLGVGIVGYLGPTGGTKNIPCGTVYISVVIHRSLFRKKITVRGERKDAQKKAALFALAFLAEKLLNGDVV